MLDLTVRRLRAFPVRLGQGLAPALQAVVRAELARLGFALEEDVLDQLHPSWATHWPEIRNALASLRGDDVVYVPLFSAFPNDIPDDWAYLSQRILAYLGLDTLDRSRFGGDPVTQLHDPELFAAALERQSTRADGRVETLVLPVLELHALDAALAAWRDGLLASKSAIPEAQHADLQRVLVHLGTQDLDLEAIGQKETAALVLASFWRAGNLDAVRDLAKTPTDLLRLFAALTNTDVSLSTSMRFPRFTRAQRRCVMSVLERAPRLEEDLLRYTSLWKSVARSLHTREFARSHPRTVAAVQALRAGELRSWESVSEEGIRLRDPAVLAHISERPGSFARRLHQLLRTFDSDRVLNAFAQIAHEVPTKVLLSLHSHFSSIDTAKERAIVTKRGRIKVLKNPYKNKLGAAGVAPILALLDDALLRAFSTKSSWVGQSVYIHPALAYYTVPLQLRAASDGLLCLGRGSRLWAGDAPVIRLFVWWMQVARDTDLDLSAVTFDEHFKYLGHVSYTQLSGVGMAHSGDRQSSGPEGAAEFIDVKLDALGPKVRYLAPQIHCYHGEPFGTVVAHAGWMLRDEVNADYAGFDAATVQNKFVLDGVGSYAVPFVLDVVSGQLVLVDLYIGSGAIASNTEGSLNGLSAACQAVSKFITTRPNLAHLARLHTQARGGQLTHDPHADIVFGIDSGTYRVDRPMELLSELL